MWGVFRRLYVIYTKKVIDYGGTQEQAATWRVGLLGMQKKGSELVPGKMSVLIEIVLRVIIEQYAKSVETEKDITPEL